MRRVSFLPADHAPEPPVPALTTPGLAESVVRSLGKDTATVTYTGRSALSALFAHLALRREDEVLIDTTFDFPNVSSCVTRMVFHYCGPLEVLTDRGTSSRSRSERMPGRAD
jgi:hypothetical protein